MLLRKVRCSSSISSIAIYAGRQSSSSLCSSWPKGNEVSGISSCHTKLGQNFPSFIRFQPYSINPPEVPLLIQARDPSLLPLEIVKCLNERRLHDAWLLFEKLLFADGIPPKPVVIQLIAISAESLNVDFLIKSERLVRKIEEDGKEELLGKPSLIYLSFCLAKCQLPVESATILRTLIKMELYPPVAAWSAILCHLCKTHAGASLAAEIVTEIGNLFQDGRIDPRKKKNSPLVAMKPNANTFTIALTGCLNFQLCRKAENLLPMLPRLNIKLDEPLMIAMAHVYERNGRKEELKKLARFIDDAPGLSDSQIRQFHNCLLMCHMKLGDLAFASEMVLKMLRLSRKAKLSLSSPSSPSSNHISLPEPPLSPQPEPNLIEYQEFLHDRSFKYLEAEARRGVTKANEGEVLVTKHGILQPTGELYAKITKAYLELGKTKELGSFLIKAEREDSPSSNDRSLIIQVINTCISGNKLDEAHDLLDEMRLNGIRVSSSVYSSLMKSYCRNKRVSEAVSLLRDSRRANVQLDRESYELLIKSKIEVNDDEGAALVFQEMKQGKILKREMPDTWTVGDDEVTRMLGEEMGAATELTAATAGVHYWNNVIHFFARKRMMKDAERALEKMKGMGHVANAETYHSMVTGYAAAGRSYGEVATMWGEMKRAVGRGELRLDQEAFDSVLYVFVRGGFFVRANEVVQALEDGPMFVDRYKYRMLFLKYHKTLCKGKPSKAQTEAQCKRRLAVLRFKKWVGLL